MGLHQTCQNPYHYFDKDFDVDMTYDKHKQDYVLMGVCRECGCVRIIYENQLKDEKVIETKLKGERNEY